MGNESSSQPQEARSAQQIAERSAAAMMQGDRASAAAGIVVDAVAPGRARARLTVRESMLNGHAIAHGGWVFLLADTAFALACNSYGAVTVAAGCDIDFVESARADDQLIAEAVERYRRGRSGLYDITVRRVSDGVVLAEMRGRSRTVRGSLLDDVPPGDEAPPPDRPVPPDAAGSDGNG